MGACTITNHNCLVGYHPGAMGRMLLAGLGTTFMQQATGVEAATYYTPEVGHVPFCNLLKTKLQHWIGSCDFILLL